jgi:hypothetical protein
MSAIFSLSSISFTSLFLFHVPYAHAQDSAPPFSSQRPKWWVHVMIVSLWIRSHLLHLTIHECLKVTKSYFTSNFVIFTGAGTTRQVSAHPSCAQHQHWWKTKDYVRAHLYQGT